jgi:hypothetical protein
MFALRKDERKLQYSRNNILGFISRVIIMCPTELIKNATHNTFSNYRKKLATEIQLFSEMAKQARVYLIFNA